MFEEMGIDEQVDYLRDCLPLTQFNEVTSGTEDYTDGTVDALIQEGKNAVKLQMQEGRDHWKHLIESDLIDVMSDGDMYEKSYRELLYYSVAMGNSGLETSPVPFQYNIDREISQDIEDDKHDIELMKETIIENGDNDIEAAFSRVGRNIWDEIGDSPEIRFAFFEDKDHLYLEFWVKARDEREFNEREGEFVEWPDIRKLDCRIHFDDQVIELRGRKDREKDREGVLKFVERIFGNTTAIELRGDELEITDDTIRYFMGLSEFVSNPHSSKAGAARSSWTSDSDVRNDPEYPDHRPHNYGNMVFNLSDVGRVSFQLSADDESFRVFKHKITPVEHRQVVEYIWENINAANN
jgi:hypothetical protein